MENKPFICKFSNIKGNKYIYCTNTNRIMESTNIVYDIIDYLGEDNVEKIMTNQNNKYSKNDIIMTLEELNKLRMNVNFGSSDRPKNMKMNTSQHDFDLKLKTSLRMVTLNVLRFS